MRPVLPPDLKPHSFLTLEEAAAILNVKLRWMRDALYDGRIAHYKVGRLVRIQAVDLMAFVAACRVDAGARPESGPAITNEVTGAPRSPAGSGPGTSRRVRDQGTHPTRSEPGIVPIWETRRPGTRPVA